MTSLASTAAQVLELGPGSVLARLTAGLSSIVLLPETRTLLQGSTQPCQRNQLLTLAYWWGMHIFTNVLLRI
jgi:hypothetical protein